MYLLVSGEAEAEAETEAAVVEAVVEVLEAADGVAGCEVCDGAWAAASVLSTAIRVLESAPATSICNGIRGVTNIGL